MRLLSCNLLLPSPSLSLPKHFLAVTPVVIYCEANTERYEHVGNLRDSRESQTTLDITLAASYGCCIEC